MIQVLFSERTAFGLGDMANETIRFASELVPILERVEDPVGRSLTTANQEPESSHRQVAADWIRVTKSLNPSGREFANLSDIA